MAESITPQDLENVKEDIEDIGQSSNERMIINPRYGAPYKSIPLLSDEFQAAIEAAAATGAGANGWTDLLIQTIDGSTQRAKNTSFQSQINDKASTAYVDAQDAVKADNSYVDAQDANLQTQINGKASAAYLDNALDEQTQTVNTALSQLSTLAAKFYPTLAAANADIANIAVNQPIQVGESGANGGLYYKATAGATTLTKSLYDPLTQSKNYADAKITDRNHLDFNYSHVGNLAAGTDLNVRIKEGTYLTLGALVNAPSGIGLNVLFKNENYGNRYVQTIYDLTDADKSWKRIIRFNTTGELLSAEAWKIIKSAKNIPRADLADNFLYAGVLTSSSDLNATQKDGTYVATSVPLNAPIGAPAIAFVTVAKAGSMVRQTYADVHDASTSWTRTFQNVSSNIVSSGWKRGSSEIATSSKLGVIKIGQGLNIQPDGTLSVITPSQQNIFSGKKLVCFGDSITEFKDYPEQVRNILGLEEAYNVGFGGCQMSAHSAIDYREMCMYRLADYIATGNYTGLIAAAQALFERTGDDNRAIVARLAAIDFNTVDYITIFYGTNDWANNPGNLGLVTENTPDGSTYLGSANYVIERLQTAYPHLKILFLTPIYRTRILVGDNKNTDDYPNYSGEYMYQYVEGLQAVAKKNHVLCVDMYNESGINKYTAVKYLMPEGLHLSDDGAALMAKKIAAKIRANF